MKKQIQFLFVILLFSIISAQEINIDYPEKVKLDEEFELKIKLIDFEEDTYDLKIDITCSGNRISRILNNDQWKSTFYYINNAIEQDQEKKEACRYPRRRKQSSAKDNEYLF